MASRWSKYKELCEANKISQITFNSRINRGWTELEAATDPVGKKVGRPSSLAPEVKAMVKEKKVNMNTVRVRVSRGMPIEEAVIKPVKKRRKKCEMGN